MSHRPEIALYFDPVSHHFLNDRLFDVEFAGHSGDRILAPYVHLKDFLNARGVKVRTADFLPAKPDGVRNIYVSAGRLSNYKRLVGRPDITLSAFFAIECPTVEPGVYKELKHAQHSFKRVFSWSDSAALEPFVGGPLRCLPLYWPQSYDGVHEGIWGGTERGFLVMINGNKFPRYRSHCVELYSQRLRAVEFFAKTREIDLYGIGWDRDPMIVGRAVVPGTFGKLTVPGTVQRLQTATATWWHSLFPDPRLVAARSVYRGPAASKAAVLGKYKFSICFENSILKGWITEKIFDCFFAGTVPVYWGAPNVEEYIPKECFIDMRLFSNYAELREHLKSMTPRRITEYKESARDFLNSPRFRPFSKEAFAELFARIIEEDTGVTLPVPSRGLTS